MRLTSIIGLAALCGLLLAGPVSAQCVEGNCINGSGTKITRGHKYTGQFVDNRRQGYGTYEFPNGDVYRGDFSQGDMEGQGTYAYANGDRYKGGFKDNLPDGVGEFSYADGKVLRGVFRKGVLVGPDEKIESSDLPEGEGDDRTDSVSVRPWNTDADHAGSEGLGGGSTF